jgi:hypothetical protein
MTGSGTACWCRGTRTAGPIWAPGFPVRPELAAALHRESKIVGIYGHDRNLAVSRVLPHTLEVRPEGLWGGIFVNATALGDQLLAEIDGGARDGLSIEASDLVLDAAGGVISGRVDFVAHVPVGAYSSARIDRAASAPSNGVPVTLPVPAAQPAAPAPVLQANLTQGLPLVQAPAQPAAPAPAPAPAPADVAAQLQTLLASLQPAAPAPAPAADPALLQLLAGLAQLQAGAHVAPAGGVPSAASLLPGAPQVPAATAPAPTAGQTLTGETDPIREAASLAARLHETGGRDATLLAALQDVTASGLPLFQESASRLGQKLWEGTKDTARPFVDYMTQDTLESMRYYGWEWTQLPEMQEWVGDKTAIIGNPVDLRQVPFDAKRCAAGWDVDRKFRDFPSPEFWREFFTEQTNAYRRLSNSWAAQAILAAALDVTTAANFIGAGGANAVLPAEAADLVPSTGVPAGALQIIKAVMIGNVILENTPRVEQTADYVLVNAFDWLSIADLAAIDLPAFLRLLKVNPEQFRTTTKVPRGKVIVGAKGAMKYRELPGAEGKGSPIRVEALDVARGGVDSAVYGYIGISRERVGGVLSVPLEAAAS